jgi:hypothetical protein
MCTASQQVPAAVGATRHRQLQAFRFELLEARTSQKRRASDLDAGAIELEKSGAPGHGEQEPGGTRFGAEEAPVDLANSDLQAAVRSASRSIAAPDSGQAGYGGGPRRSRPERRSRARRAPPNGRAFGSRKAV